MRGYVGLDRLGLEWLEKTALFGARDATHIDGHEHIGGAVGTLGFHPRHQLVGLGLDPVDGNAGFLGEGSIERVVTVIVTAGIEIDLLRQGRGGQGHEGGDAHRGFERVHRESFLVSE